MNAGAGPSGELKALSATAVLGIDRSGPDGETPGAVLTCAAVAGMRALAGRRCNANVQLIEACPAETRSAATASQSAILELLLASPDAALIQEWCLLARARGVRVPAGSVPALLDWWARQPSRSPEVFDATGACGVWLAGLNPVWRKPVAASEIPVDADEVWETGSSADRASLLLAVRRADPPRALAMVRATWDADGAEERRKFVEALGRDASAQDETFLESALDDRSKAVRREAARALTGLAGSALRARMRERAAGMIIIEKTKAGLLRREQLKIRIEPPMEFDKAWERDGLEEQTASGKGMRAFWMVQVLSSTDLSTWTALSGVGPRELIELIGGDEYFDDVFAAMCASMAGCPGQPDAASWSEAIMAASADRKLASEAQLAAVWRAQSLERSEKMRLEYASRDQTLSGVAAWRLLVSDPRGWSLDFSTRAAALLLVVTTKTTESWDLWSPIESASRLLHPGAADLFTRLLDEMFPDGPSESIRKSLDRIRLRAEMHKEFQS